MTGNKCYLTEYEYYDGGFVYFGDGKGRISRKGKIKTRILDFVNVYFCKELKYNLFSVSQIYDKKNNILFTDTECLVLSSDFKLLDESQVLLTVPRKDNIYSVDLKSVNPTKGETLLEVCLQRFLKMIILVLLVRKESNTKPPNGVAERRNRTLIEAARTLLVDSKLPTTFWTEAVNTACYVLNRVLLIKPHTKTPYELICVRTPLIDFMKPFGCPVTILNIRDHLGTRDNIVAGQAKKKIEPKQEYILIPFCTTNPLISQGPKDSEEDVSMKPTEVNASGASDKGEEDEQDTRSEFERLLQKEKQTNSFNTVGTPVSVAGPSFSNDDPSSPVNAAEASNAFEDHLFERFSPFKNAFALPHVPNVFSIDDTGIFGNAYDDEDVGAEADLNNLETTMNVSPIPTTRIDKDHPKDQIIGDLNSAIQTRRMTKISDEHAMFWTLVDLPNGKRAIGTKWVFRNKKDERGIVVRNKARLVAQGYTQAKGIDYDKVFAPVARIEAIRLFLAYALFMGFIVYQIDVKSAFLYGTIEEEVYVCQPPGFENPHFPNKMYRVEKALYGLHQAPRAWYETLSTYLIENGFRIGIIDKTLFIKKDKGDILLVQVYIDDIIFESTKKSLCDKFEGLMHMGFQMSSIGELTFFLGLQVQQKEDGIFISQDKYVAEILKKFDFATVKTASTPIETNKALVKDEEAEVVDFHLYKSMIGSLIYLIASRPDICLMFVLVQDSPFDLEAFSDSDYAGASLDRKFTTGGCQFLGKRLISWQCKKQTIVANFATEAEYVATVNYCRQVLWIQNQMLDYGFNFINTKIYIDNKSTICIVKNPVIHSKTKHIEIRHHFIKDSYKKKLIQVIKIHTDHNVADLLTKAFDVSRYVKRGRDTKIPQSSGPPVKVGDEAVYKELGDIMERAATTASSLEAEQDSDSGIPTDSQQTPITTQLLSSRPQKKQSRRKQRKETEVAQDETHHDDSVLDLEKTKDAQAKEIADLKKGGRLDDAKMFDIDDLHDDKVILDMGVGEKQEKSVKINEREVSIGVEDSDAPTILVTTDDEEVIAAKINEITPTSAPTIVIDELTLAQTLIEIKAAKPKAVTTASTTTTTRPKAREFIVQEPSEFGTTTSSP
ncbi:putative ribonuclease H-like domain-containing protein [Tanacetum coccineum]|uniref:Ribonuclease H-like domain-containing protein n=1 Tax=Tanacetum coccineum TaxID=301880 RepID=A0ABQ5GPG3_9ASTR